MQNLRDIDSRKPPYPKSLKVVIKPDAPESEGVDCSRLKYLAARRAGLLVTRVTAKDMAYGRGGWTGFDLVDGLRNGDEGDLVWWTWRDRPDRPCGHVGTIITGSSGLLEVLHASSGKRTTSIDPLTGVLIRDLVKTRRLTIGDPKRANAKVKAAKEAASRWQNEDEDQR